jgi:hypothetical protein
MIEQRQGSEPLDLTSPAEAVDAPGFTPGTEDVDAPGRGSGPANGAEPPGPPPRAGSRLRIAIGTVWLLVAAGLVYIAPGTPWSHSDGAAPAVIVDNSHAQMSRTAPTAYSGFIRTPLNTVAVDVTPATAGINTVGFTVLDAQGLPVPVKHWSATATLPGSTAAPVAIALSPFGDSSATAAPQLPTAGQWTFKITVRTGSAAPVTFTHVVPIAPA